MAVSEGTVLTLRVIDLHEAGAPHRVTAHRWGSWVEAASVCFARFHDAPPPPTSCTVRRPHHDPFYLGVTWRAPDTVAQDSYKNEPDATCEGAYCIAVVTLHEAEGWRYQGRTSHATGADLLFARDGDGVDDFVKCEVSGVSASGTPVGEKSMRARIVDKTHQVRTGKRKLDRPGIAVVVGFQTGHVLVSEVQP